MNISKESHFDENRKDYWNRAYESHKGRSSRSPNWLEAQEDILIPSSYLLELGCGSGATTEYLISRGHRVIATDISDVALERLRSRLPAAETKMIDFTGGLPWNKETFDHVVADLCLHYFDIDTTKRVVADILRVLKGGGCLLARVNSVKDTIHGFGKGTLIEPNYFLSDGHYKRFFDRELIEEVCQPFELLRVAESSTHTMRGRKQLYEIIAKRPEKT